jgi:hypothetical protein
MRNLNNEELIVYAGMVMIVRDGESDQNEVKTLLKAIEAFTSGYANLDVSGINGYCMDDLKSMGLEGPSLVAKHNLSKADANTQKNVCLALAHIALADGIVTDEENIFFNECLSISGLTLDDLK